MPDDRTLADDLAAFQAELPTLGMFSDVADATAWRAIPDGWLVGIADVVSSTAAIAAGRYKAVNMVGASVVTAVRNALATDRLAFVFGGDGAAFVVPDRAHGRVAEALARASRWADDEMGLSLRTALVPIAAIRAAGRDVRAARFAVSPSVGYVMFSGGGLAWADEQMKHGQFLVPPAEAGHWPDLTGLSCRWQPLRSRRGVIASVLVAPIADGNTAAYRSLLLELFALIRAASEDDGQPIDVDRAQFGLSFRAVDLETRATRGNRPYWRHALYLAWFHAFAWLIFKVGRPVGGFDPKRYTQETVRNTDFRKFDDGLKLTIDCSDETVQRMTDLLERGYRGRVAVYGLHTQDAALLTCIVPAQRADDHLHFVDGSDGGYAEAARQLKMRRAAAA